MESPIETAAEVTDERVTQLFSLLGNETRLAVILTLAEASEPLNRETWNPTGMNALPFSELRERVGSGDPGNFNYHLKKLDGEFIQQTTDGYELTSAGRRIVKTVISIAGSEETALPTTPIELACPNCGAPTAITHRRQRMYHVCTGCDGNVVVGDRHPSGVLSGVMLDRSVIRNRSPEDVVLAQYAWKFFSFALALEGVCMMCSGRVEGSLRVCGEHEAETGGPCSSCGYSYEVTGQFVCTVCNHTKLWGIIPLTVIHPAGIAFCREHGIELAFGDGDLGILERLFDLFGRSGLEISSRAPPRVRVTLRDAGDELRVTFDETLGVVEVNQ
jgi:DNA-binding transcriptional ArsR family regulator/rubredoxin